MFRAQSNSFCSQRSDCLQQERVNVISFLSEQYFGRCFVSGPQPLMVCSDLLPDCRQLWCVHIKCIQWIFPVSFSSAEGTYLQLQRLTAASGAIVGLPKPPAFLLSNGHALSLQQERMFNTMFFPPDDRVGKWDSRKTTVHGGYSPGIDLPPISLLVVFCISIFTSLHSVASRCQPSHPAAVPNVVEVIVDNLWRLCYLVWEMPGFELK